MMKPDFDKKYSSASNFYYNLKPLKIVFKSVNYIRNGHVLDMGAGDGVNAIFLAKKHFTVFAIDSSRAGLSKLRKNAHYNNVKIKTKECLIENFKYKRKYSAIFSLSVLHFIKRKFLKKIINGMKYNTLEKGVNVVSVMTVSDSGFKKHPRSNTYFRKNELRNFYKDWKIVYYKEGKAPLQRHGKGKWHRHGFAAIIAVKD